MRSIREQPFCWQEKNILRFLRKHYIKTELVKLRCLYGTITEMDSDFNGKEIKYYTKSIHTYSGLSLEWIPTGLKILEKHKIIKMVEERNKGKFKAKYLIFTPENIEELPRKTVHGKPSNGESFNGENVPLEDSTFLENSNIKEDSTYKELSKDNNNSKELYNQLNSNCLKIIDKIKTSFSNIKHFNGKTPFNHTIPKEREKPTNTILNMCRIIISIKEGSFYSYYCRKCGLDNKFKNKYEIKELPEVSKSKTWEETESLIFKALDEYKLQFNSYILNSSEKRGLTVSLESFFYNKQLKKSYFMSCLCHPIHKRISIRVNRIKSKIPEEIKDKVLDIYNDKMNEIEFWKAIRDMYFWYDKNNKILREHNEKICDQCGYTFLTDVGNPKRFFNRYISFIKSKCNPVYTKNIGVNNPTWDWFKNDCWRQEDPFSLDFTKRKNPYEHYEDATEDLYDFGEIEAVI